MRFQTYVDSATRFGDIVAKAGADALIANHTNLDGSKVKIPALASRKPGEENPYVIGKDAVRGSEECARASLLREK
jgi:metallo-beta-lactamase class B